MMRPVVLEKNERGFSLPEMMVVTVVVVTMAFLFIPPFARWMDNVRLVSSARLLASEIVMARRTAASTMMPVVIKPDVADGSVRFFVNVDDDEDFLYQPVEGNPIRTADYELKTVRLTDNIGDDAISFRGYGDTKPGGGNDPNGGTGNGGGNSGSKPGGGKPGGGNANGTESSGSNGGGGGRFFDISDPLVGMTSDGNGDPVLVIDPIGSVRQAGAFRLTHDGLNVIEVVVSRSGKIELRKLYLGTERAHAYYSPGRIEPGEPLWKWY